MTRKERAAAAKARIAQRAARKAEGMPFAGHRNQAEVASDEAAIARAA